jgi:D-alanyl-D-alanine carboxypeptidase
MFFACGMQQRRLVVLVVTALAALLVSGCGGGDGASQEEDSAEDTTTTTEDTEQATTTGNTGQAPEDALNAALDQSFAESAAPGVVAAVQTPDYTWVETRGVADRTSEEPMTPNVYHRIGSVT